MDSLLAPHLEGISSAAAGISSYRFAPPKIFTNAILRSTNIVSLIRDSDAQEQALFTMPTPTHSRQTEGTAKTSGAPRRNNAVQTVLGGDMMAQLRRGGAGIGGAVTGDVDVELLLLGAEKLTSVYHIPGAAKRIVVARERFEQLTESITNYEALVEAQRSQLELMNQNVDEEEEELPVLQESTYVTDEMLEQEEEAIAELEKKREAMELKIKNLDRQMSSVYRAI